MTHRADCIRAITQSLLAVEKPGCDYHKQEVEAALAVAATTAAAMSGQSERIPVPKITEAMEAMLQVLADHFDLDGLEG